MTSLMTGSEYQHTHYPKHLSCICIVFKVFSTSYFEIFSSLSHPLILYCGTDNVRLFFLYRYTSILSNHPLSISHFCLPFVIEDMLHTSV